jgi:hypothetical protein
MKYQSKKLEKALTIGGALPQQLKAAGFDVKKLKISGTSARLVFV